MNVDYTYEYPARPRRIVRMVSVLVLVFNLIEYVMALLSVIYRIVLDRTVDVLPANSPLPFLQPVPDPFIARTLLTAHLGLLVALILARMIAYLAPAITIAENGLWARTWLGKRFIADKGITGVHSVEMPNERFLIWVDAKQGLPLQNLLGLLLLGRRSWSGFMLTSDLTGFDEIAGRVFQNLRQNFGEEHLQARYSEEKPTPQLEMLTRPFKVVWEAARIEPNPLTRREATLQMISASVSLALPLLVAALIHLQVPWGALIVPIAAMLEWPFAAAFIFAISENYPRRVSFDEALRLYPLTQLPRWGVAFGLTVLVAMGCPWLLFVPALIPAVAISGMAVIKLTEGIFNLQFPASLIGVIVTLIYQAIVYGLFLALLPR
ncbi:MAG: hypothetical protein HZB53_22200 [Chloroflexi bacterium]|nr:hypothetical protein [Chloroflexota bacterium]